MDGARAYDHQEALSVLSMKDSSDRFSGLDDERRRLIGNGQFSFNGARRRQRLDFNDMLIVDRSIHEEVRLSKGLLSDYGEDNLANYTGKVHTGPVDRPISFDDTLWEEWLQFLPWTLIFLRHVSYDVQILLLVTPCRSGSGNGLYHPGTGSLCGSSGCPP
jgi:hypothetical protein